MESKNSQHEDGDTSQTSGYLGLLGDCPLRDLGKFQGIRNVPHLAGTCIGQIVCLRYVCFTVCMVYLN